MKRFYAFISLLILATLTFAFLGIGQTEEMQVPKSENYSKSYLFDGALDKSTSPLMLKPGSVQDLQNVKRPGPGVPLGWTPRSGTTRFNTTAIAAAAVKGLFHHVNSELSVDSFYAQANDAFYLASVVPPSTTTTFGTNAYSLDTGTLAAFGESIGDDLILAASGTSPWATSGTTAYPDAFRIDRNSGNTTYEDGYDYVRDNRDDTYVVITQSASESLYVGFRRRLTGVYLDFVTGSTNAVASAVSGYARRAQAWSEITLTDGTAQDVTGATTFYKDGLISWTGSVLDQHYVLPGTKDDLFWYKFTPTGNVTDGIKVTKALVLDRTEAVTNLWSGMYDSALGCFVSSTTGYLTNYTGEINDGTEYEYADLSSATTAQALYLGFGFKAFGFYLGLVDTAVNTGTSTAATVKYWNATTSTWTTVGTITDGTKNGNYSMSQSGVMQWDGNAITEAKSVLGDILTPLYWYQVTWSAAMPSTGPQVYEVGHVQKPDSIPPMPAYEFVIEMAGRAMYGPGVVNKHGVDFSYPGLPHIMNGPLAGSTGNIFGPGIPNAACRHYMNAIVTTKNPYRTYLLEGKVPGKWDELLLSDRVGAVAPKTLLYVSDGIRLFSQDRSTHATFMLAQDGVYATDGQTLICISHPISKYWDLSEGPYIEPSYASLSYAWVDYLEKTIHFAVPINTAGTGTQTTLNRELVYNYITGEWYDVYKRAAPLACGASIIGSNGQSLAYGGDYSGTVHKLNTGTKDNTTAIEYFVTTSDIQPLEGIRPDALNFSSQLWGLKIKGESGTTGTVEVTVYPDGATTAATTDSTMSMVHSGYKYYMDRITFPDTVQGESFALKFRSGVTESGADGSFLGFTLDFFPVMETY